MEDLFRSGTLEMSATPLDAMAVDLPWGEVLTNQVLAVIAVALLLVALPDFFRLLPDLLFSFDRSRGAAALEHSVSQARTRNLIALSCILPFCLAVDRYALWRPDFLTAVPAAWTAPAILGAAIVFLLFRELMYLLLRPRRLAGEEADTLHHAPYNYFILLTILVLATAGLLSLAGCGDAVVPRVLLWETAIVWLFAILRSGQFLAGHCNVFSTFLYLCGLEIVPVALVVAVVVFF